MADEPMDMNGLQNLPDLRQTPPPVAQPPRYVHIPNRNRMITSATLLDQQEFLREIASGVLALVSQTVIIYNGNSEEDWIEINVQYYKFHFSLNYAEGLTELRTNARGDVTKFPGLHYVEAASIFLDYFLRACRYTVYSFSPKSDHIAEGFPAHAMTVGSFEVVNEIDKIDEIIERWMPFVDIIEHLEVGYLENEQEMERFQAIYTQYLNGKVEAWGGKNPPLQIVNWLRCQLSKVTLEESLLPVATVFRWIKAWMMGLEGFAHLAEICYSNAEYVLTSEVFRVFLKIKEDFSKSGTLTLRNFRGQCANLHIDEDGDLIFMVLDDVYEYIEDGTKRNFPFKVEELMDTPENFQKDLEMSASPEAYAILRDVPTEES